MQKIIWNNEKLPPIKDIYDKGLVVIQAFYPAQTSVLLDRNEARNPLLHIASTVMHHGKSPGLLIFNRCAVKQSPRNRATT